MKLTIANLKAMGLYHLKKGREIYVPSPFFKQIDLLFDDDKTITAIIHEKNLKDYQSNVRVLMLLNQLCRYYKRPIVIHCISYRTFCSAEKIYQTFFKSPSQLKKVG